MGAQKQQLQNGQSAFSKATGGSDVSIAKQEATAAAEKAKRWERFWCQLQIINQQDREEFEPQK